MSETGTQYNAPKRTSREGEEFEVRDAGGDYLKKYRTEIPNLVDDLDLNPYEFRLYVHLKRVAGESGRCFQGTRGLARSCNISQPSVVRARASLKERGLIRIAPPDRPGGAENITITNIWERNMAAFGPDRGTPRGDSHRIAFSRKSDEGDSQGIEVILTESEGDSQGIGGDSVVSHKKELLKKEPVKNKDSVSSTPSGADDPDRIRSRERTSSGTIKGLKNEEAAVLIQEAMDGDRFVEELRNVYRIGAAENKTNEMKLTRVWNSFVEPYLQARDREPWSDESWEYGFKEAIRMEKGSLGYVKTCAKNHHVRAGQPSHYRSDSDPMSGATAANVEPEKDYSFLFGKSEGQGQNGSGDLTEEERRELERRHSRRYGSEAR